MAIIISQPMLMINENKQNSAIKLHATYQYKSSGVHTNLLPLDSGEIQSTDISIYGVDKRGSTLLATCPLNTIAGYTAMEIASSVVIGIPVEDYAYIYYSYTPTADFAKIVNGIAGQPGIQIFAEQRTYPDSIDLVNKHTLSTLT